MDIFLDEHKRFLLLLLKHHVEFILIGGYAVIYYGYQRGTADMDIWLKPDNTNREHFISALREQGIIDESLREIGKMDFTKAKLLHIGAQPNRIDFLTKIDGMNYELADKEKKLLPMDNQFVPVINYNHLIAMKTIAGRPQDKADIDVLEKINRFRK